MQKLEDHNCCGSIAQSMPSKSGRAMFDLKYECQLVSQSELINERKRNKCVEKRDQD